VRFLARLAVPLFPTLLALDGGCNSTSTCVYSAAGSTATNAVGSGGSASPSTDVTVDSGGVSSTPQSLMPDGGYAVEAAAVGAGYRFTLGVGDYYGVLILAEGGGTPQILSASPCSAPSVQWAIPLPDSTWHVVLLGAGSPALGATFVALACNGESCALYDNRDAATTGEASVVDGSEIAVAAFRFIGTRTSTDDSGNSEERLCLYSTTDYRCFGSSGWEAPVTISPVVEHAFVPPLCADETLVAYANGYGATSDGRLIWVNVGSDIAERCTVLTEPLGAPVRFIDANCGIATNMWLLTEQTLYRSGCNCAID
jgi:hypothetical protein